MRKRIFFIVVLAFVGVLMSCENDEENTSEAKSCNVSNPIEELVWLKNKIEKAGVYDRYIETNYRGEIVFYNVNCNPVINSVFIVYNCSGEKIGLVNDLSSEFSTDKIVWEHSESKCEILFD